MDNEEHKEMRDYQKELYIMAKKKNIIACLGTGTGKTLIGINLMFDQQFLSQLKGSYRSGEAKRTFLLVPTCPLVYQQKSAIKEFIDTFNKTQNEQEHTLNVNVGHFTGDMNVDYYNKEEWDEELEKYQIIVMTAQILLNMLNHRFITFDMINLLIIDEVHWGAKTKNKKDSGHPYKRIMEIYKSFNKKLRIHNKNSNEGLIPRVLGLSATPINCSVPVREFPKAIESIENIYCAVCKTSDAKRYGTNPMERVICFTNDSSGLSNISKKVVEMLDLFMETIKKFKDQKNYSSVLDRMKKVLRNIRNILADPKNKTINDEQTGENFPLFMTWMGVWCASIAVNFYIDEITEYKDVDQLHRKYWELFIKYLEKISELLNKEIRNDPKAALNTASPKMNLLLKILEPYKQKERNDSELCGIIFVNQRCVAKVLCDWLMEIKRIDSKYNFLEVGWVVGHSTRLGLEAKIAANSDKRQQAVIQEFRHKKLNVLVATSVLEEGLDVRECNFVVRYDRVNTFRQYLQSKGRARAQKALFYIMTAEKDRNVLEQLLKDFEKMEEMVKDIDTIKRNNSSIIEYNEDKEEDNNLVFESSIGAKVDGGSAIDLLYIYCQSLSTDSFTRLEPIFTKDVDSNFVVKLPVNCPLKGYIKANTLQSNKKLAKKAVAVEACKQLYQMKELNEYLYPVNKVKFIEYYVKKLGLREETLINDLKGRENPTKGRVGTRSRKDIVVKQIAHIFLNKRKENNYFYLSRIGLEFAKSNALPDNCLTFGLITQKKIKNKSFFSIFLKTRKYDIFDDINSSEVKVDFNPIIKIHLSSEEKEWVEKFHCYFFEEILKFSNENLVFDPKNSEFNALIVPLNNGSDIDWTFINRSHTFGSTSIRELTPFERQEYQFKSDNFEDIVFYPWYRKDQNGSPIIHYYYSQKVSNLCSNSYWTEDNYKTFADYFLKKYNIEVKNKAFPLIQGLDIGNVAQLKPYSLRFKGTYRQYFPPELITIHPFPASLWKQALCLPAILYRLNHIHLSEELRQRICLETNPGIVSLNSNNCLELNYNSIIKCSTSEINESNTAFDSSESDEECNGHQFIEDNKFALISYQLKEHRNECLTNNETKIKPKPKTEVVLNNSIDDIIKDLNSFINDFKTIINNRITNDHKDSTFGKEKEHIIITNIEEFPNIRYGEVFPFVFKGNIEPFIRGSYDSKMGDPIVGPKIDLLLQALTMIGSSDAFNLERLEVLGDSFLKFVTSCYVYFSSLYTCPELDEGQLSYLRQIQICNCNLYLIGCEKNIDKLLISHKWIPKQNWLPPGYHISEERDLQILLSQENEGQNNSNKRSDSFRRNIINNKSIADSIEALIGAHLMVGGNKSALTFMEWLGLKVKPLGANDIDYLNERQLFNWLPKPKEPNYRNDLSQTEFQTFIGDHFSNLDDFEKLIGYKFQNKVFLIQALTHSSFYFNEFTDCYQKLEFLGDAIIDYLISRHIFSSNDFSPGELTELRSALVNNSFFASIAIKFKFHKFLRNCSPDLKHAIQKFEENFMKSEIDSVINSINKLTEEECIDIEEIEVPKALGDIFESVAGAIFLDNGQSLDGVWKVYYKLLKPEIDYFTKNIPKMPVKQIWELCPSLKFGPSERVGPKTHVVLSVNDKEYGGVGKNKKFAKIAAAKNALKDLKHI